MIIIYNNYICIYLACIRKKNIECFKYLYENYFLFDNSKLFYNILKHAEIEFFKYLDSKRFELSHSMYHNIIRYNREDIIIYLKENKPILNKMIFNAYKKISNKTINNSNIKNYNKNTINSIIMTNSISDDSDSEY